MFIYMSSFETTADLFLTLTEKLLTMDFAMIIFYKLYQNIWIF